MVFHTPERKLGDEDYDGMPALEHSSPSADGETTDLLPPPIDHLPAPPSGKLAAVTRQMNSMESTLKEFPDNLPMLKDMFTKYLSKVEALYEACSEEDQKWLSSHSDIIMDFRCRMDKLLYPAPSTSRISYKKSSVCSTTSSTRFKLIEQRAKLQDRREAQVKSNLLDVEELSLKRELEDKFVSLKQRREKIEQEEIESELILLEEQLAGVGSSRA